MDIPLLAVCLKANVKNDAFTDVRLSINNGIQFALRDTACEQFLNGKKFAYELSTQSLDHLDTKIYDTRSDEYKRHMFRICIKECVEEIMQKDA